LQTEKQFEEKMNGQSWIDLREHASGPLL
jgi:hypothetical protein